METVSQMLKSSTDRAFENATDVLSECVRACLECEQACVSCADSCLGSDSVASLRRCIRLCLDCADCCDGACRMLSRQCESDVELVRRQKQDGSGGATFYLNHSDQPVSVPLDRPSTDLLSSETIRGTLSLGPFGVAILADA